MTEEDLSTLSTEGRDPALAEIDQSPTVEVVRAVVGGHQEVLAAVAAVEDAVARLAERVAERMDRGGRVIYAGAGTGGRVALLDAAEWGPIGCIISSGSSSERMFDPSICGSTDVSSLMIFIRWISDVG